MKEEAPYIIKTKKIKIFKYTKNYGDDRICECGHSYYRHFDTYENMRPVGCKYCSCYRFVEKNRTKDKQQSRIPVKDEIAGAAPVGSAN